MSPRQCKRRRLATPRPRSRDFIVTIYTLEMLKDYFNAVKDERLRAFLYQSVEPCIYLVPNKAAKIDLGRSCLEGKPHLPDGIEWPTHRRHPLTFLAQINLGDIPTNSAPLPSSGMLYFFYREHQPMLDPYTELIYLSDEQAAPRSLEKRTQPVPRGSFAVPNPMSVALDLVPGFTLPNPYRSHMGRYSNIDEHLFELYHSLYDDWQDQFQPSTHWLFGHKNVRANQSSSIVTQLGHFDFGAEMLFESWEYSYLSVEIDCQALERLDFSNIHGRIKCWWD